jgi:hypothetical protein
MEEKVNGNIHTTPVFSSEFTVPARQKPVQEVQASDVCCRNPAGPDVRRFGGRNLVPFRMDVLIALELPAAFPKGRVLLLPRSQSASVRRLTVKVLTLIVSRFGLTVWK